MAYMPKKKGPFNESEKARRSARIAFVDKKAGPKGGAGEKGITRAQARQRYYVQTRISEMKAKGKTVTPEMRKQLQQKFQSGDVSRRGFAAPKKKTGGSVASKPSTPAPKTTVTDREGRGGPKYVTPKLKPMSRTDSMGRSGFGSTRKSLGTAFTRSASHGSGYGGVRAPRTKESKERSVKADRYLQQLRIAKKYGKQVTIPPIGMNQSAKLAHTLYGEPTTKHSRLAHAEGARLAAPSGPYIGRNRCIANDDTCEGPKARGTDFCIGHLRNRGEA